MSKRYPTEQEATQLMNSTTRWILERARGCDRARAAFRQAQAAFSALGDGVGVGLLCDLLGEVLGVDSDEVLQWASAIRERARISLDPEPAGPDAHPEEPRGPAPSIDASPPGATASQGTIFLCADDPPAEARNTHRTRDAARAIARGALQRGFGIRVVARSSIEVASVVLDVARELPHESTPLVEVYVLKSTRRAAELAGRRGVLREVEDEADEASSAQRLRDRVLGDPGLVAGVFVGGADDVYADGEVFLACHQRLPGYAIASAGGAAAKLLTRYDELAGGEAGPLLDPVVLRAERVPYTRVARAILQAVERAQATARGTSAGEPTMTLEDLECDVDAALAAPGWPGPALLRESMMCVLRTDKILLRRIHDLQAALADALYWLKPGLERRAAEMTRDHEALYAVLHRIVRIPTTQTTVAVDVPPSGGSPC